MIQETWELFLIVCIEGSQVIISDKMKFLSLKIVLDLGKNVDPDKMPHYAEFYLGLHFSQISGDSSY